MIKKLLAAAVLASAAFGAYAQHDTMYLIKGDRVVGKYNVDDVDYATFSLPEGVNDATVWLDIVEVSKNSVTYIVNTVNPTTAYAHNAISYYTAEYAALDFMGTPFKDLSDSEKVEILQYCLSYDAYVGMDTKTFTQKDYADNSNGEHFSIIPGTQYFLCAWEINPEDYTPLETFTYEEFTTQAPEAGTATVEASVVGPYEDWGVQLAFTGNDVYYLRTCWGARSTMDQYVSAYGADYLFGLFGQAWDLEFLQSSGELGDGVPNSIWPVNGSGEYVLFIRAYDKDGNMNEYRLDVDVEEGGTAADGPKITIFSKEKTSDSVSINFEISPSNVEEAYVRMCGENFTDDRLNMGYELHEIAMGGDATDITSDINKFGEYTFSATGLEEEWKSILIYAQSKDGARTTLRINFFPDPESEWSIYNPVYAAPAKKLPAVKKIVSKRNPPLPKMNK